MCLCYLNVWQSDSVSLCLIQTSSLQYLLKSLTSKSNGSDPSLKFTHTKLKANVCQVSLSDFDLVKYRSTNNLQPIVCQHDRSKHSRNGSWTGKHIHYTTPFLGNPTNKLSRKWYLATRASTDNRECDQITPNYVFSLTDNSYQMAPRKIVSNWYLSSTILFSWVSLVTVIDQMVIIVLKPWSAFYGVQYTTDLTSRCATLQINMRQ